MRFEQNLRLGRLIKRYKRFLADVEFEDGTVVTAHVPNTGSMKSTNDPGSRVALSHHPKPERKLKWTLELIEPPGCSWVGVNTMRPNRIVEESIERGEISSLRGYSNIRREVRYGKNSRIDLLLEDGDRRCYVEVKNVTYKVGDGALFPDAVTARGAKHLEELERMVAEGHRGVIFFLINRADCNSFGPASDIDPHYAKTLSTALSNGVEAVAYRARASLEGIVVEDAIEMAF